MTMRRDAAQAEDVTALFLISRKPESRCTQGASGSEKIASK